MNVSLNLTLKNLNLYIELVINISVLAFCLFKMNLFISALGEMFLSSH
jgi:hypothetical protein